VTAISNMIDLATNEVALGLYYLDLYWSWSEYYEAAHEFLEDAIDALDLSKSLSLSGYQIDTYLANISAEIEWVKELFASVEGETESVIANYLESALQEISMS